MTSDEAREFTGQIKKAHLLLPSISLGVILAVAIGPDPGLQEAIAQLQSVEAAFQDAVGSGMDPSVNRPDAIDSDWLFESVARRELEPRSPEQVVLNPDQNYVIWQTAVRTAENELLPLEILLPAVTLVGPGRPDQNSVPDLSLTPPFTMGRFEAFWNNLGSVEVAYRFGLIDSIAFGSSGAAWEPDEQPLNEPNANPLVFSLPPSQLRALDPLASPTSPSYFAEGTARQRQAPYRSIPLTVTAHYLPLKVDARREFARRAFGPDTIKSGEFSEEFPELAEYTEGLESLAVSDLGSLLDREARRSGPGETFEIAGMKIPVRVVRVWGGGLIVVSQLYFLVHLAALTRAIGDGGMPMRLPWVGYYAEDRLATAVFVASIVALPTVATVWFTIQAGRLTGVSGTTFLTQLVLAMVSAGMAWVTWSMWARMRHALERAE